MDKVLWIKGQWGYGFLNKYLTGGYYGDTNEGARRSVSSMLFLLHFCDGPITRPPESWIMHHAPPPYLRFKNLCGWDWTLPLSKKMMALWFNLLTFLHLELCYRIEICYWVSLFNVSTVLMFVPFVIKSSNGFLFGNQLQENHRC